MSSGLPMAWEVLRRALNSEPPFFGTPGVRDPDAVCEAFDGRGYDGTGRCDSDGHYLCVECSELSPDAPRFHQYGAAGRLDRIRLLVSNREWASVSRIGAQWCAQKERGRGVREVAYAVALDFRADAIERGEHAGACPECLHPMRLHAGGVHDRCAGELYSGGAVCKVCVG